MISIIIVILSDFTLKNNVGLAFKKMVLQWVCVWDLHLVKESCVRICAHRSVVLFGKKKRCVYVDKEASQSLDSEVGYT